MLKEQENRVSPKPPAKPLRANFHDEYMNVTQDSRLSIGRSSIKTPNFYSSLNEYTPKHYLHQDFIASTDSNKNMNTYANMDKNALHALSATPKSKLTNNWVQLPTNTRPQQIYYDFNRNSDFGLQSNCYTQQNQLKRRSDPQNFCYNNHWLVQEAEQRRISQSQNIKPASRKSLPDSVIQTITQRVQSVGLGERRRYVF